MAFEICRKYEEHGIFPCKANRNLWVCDRGDHWEYVAFMDDDILVFIQDPNLIIEALKEIHQYELKWI